MERNISLIRLLDPVKMGTFEMAQIEMANTKQALKILSVLFSRDSCSLLIAVSITMPKTSANNAFLD